MPSTNCVEADREAADAIFPGGSAGLRCQREWSRQTTYPSFYRSRIALERCIVLRGTFACADWPTHRCRHPAPRERFDKLGRHQLIAIRRCGWCSAPG